MIRIFLMLVGASCLVMLALMVVSPWWRRLGLAVVTLFLVRNSAVTQAQEPAAKSEDVIEGEFRVIDP